MNKLFYILSFCGIVSLSSSCTNISVDDVEIQGIEDTEVYSYPGTIYDYLQLDDNTFGVTFGAMLTLLDYEDDNFRELKSCLSDPEGKYTLLAVPDHCFNAALSSLNIYRERNDLTTEEGELTLQMLLDSKFPVEKENPKKPEQPLIEYVEYKNDLDTIMCRYILPGIFDTSVVEKEKGGIDIKSIRYDYRMHVSCRRLPATGYIGGGIKDFTFSDMNNTKQSDKWDMAKAKWLDIHVQNGIIHIMNPGHEFSFEEFAQRFKNYGHEK